MLVRKYVVHYILGDQLMGKWVGVIVTPGAQPVLVFVFQKLRQNLADEVKFDSSLDQAVPDRLESRATVASPFSATGRSAQRDHLSSG